ncbi:MAG TPA: histidine kinase [Actinocrinis sp.]|nr:histidine kinase [Actinocrinis sp.]
MTRVYAWLQKHPYFTDGTMAGILLLFGLASIFGQDGPWRAALLGLIVLGQSVPILFRRKQPVRVCALVGGFAILQLAFKFILIFSDFAVPIAVYSIAAYRPRKYSVPALLISLIGTGAAMLSWFWTNIERQSHLDSYKLYVVGALVYGLMISPMLIAWILGDSMQYRRAYYVSLEDKANRLERERDQQAQIAAAAERARIARELHDVVAHNVSVMVVQAEGASYALNSSPEQTRQALGNIAQTGRTALAEMRRLLGVLRTEDAGAERAPQPGVGQMEDLLEQVRTAGLPVDFAVEGIPVELPQGVALAAYRIVQESLTNTRKHGGPQASARVALSYHEVELRMTITDNGRGAHAPTDGMGNGVIGMRERAALYCGVLTAGPLPGGGFEVQAVLPYKEGGEA